MVALLLLLFLISLGAVLAYAWRRSRVRAANDLAADSGEKPKFDTTMGDLRDLRQALRPLQKDGRNRNAHRQDSLPRARRP
jgi:hypothetical protein